MGWLRKVGRKIGKRLNKIFGSKLGPVVGAIGLYMLMGPVAKTLTGWASSAFGGAGAAASGTAATTATTATQAATTAASDAAAAEAIAASGVQSAGASAKLSETALLASDNLAKQAVSTTATNQTVAGQIANATNNMDVANSAISAIDSAALSGSTNVYPTITDSLINEAVPALDQPLSVVKNNLADQTQLAFDSSKYTNLEAGKISPEMLTDSFNAPVSGQATSGPTVDFNAIADDIANKRKFGIDNINLQDFVPTEQVPVTQSIKYPPQMRETIVTAPRLDPATTQIDIPNFTGENLKEDILAENTFVGTGTGGVDLPKTFGQKAKAQFTNYMGKDFIPDVGRGVTTSLIMQEIAGDPKERFVSAGVAGQPVSEAAQGNYVQAVAPSAMAATGMTRMPSFQELSQQTLYGTGSPNYLSQFYQPLATPQLG